MITRRRVCSSRSVSKKESAACFERASEIKSRNNSTSRSKCGCNDELRLCSADGLRTLMGSRDFRM